MDGIISTFANIFLGPFPTPCDDGQHTPGEVVVTKWKNKMSGCEMDKRRVNCAKCSCTVYVIFRKDGIIEYEYNAKKLTDSIIQEFKDAAK
jgi:hypothetical protein